MLPVNAEFRYAKVANLCESETQVCKFRIWPTATARATAWRPQIWMAFSPSKLRRIVSIKVIEVPIDEIRCTSWRERPQKLTQTTVRSKSNQRSLYSQHRGVLLASSDSIRYINVSRRPRLVGDEVDRLEIGPIWIVKGDTETPSLMQMIMHNGIWDLT